MLSKAQRMIAYMLAGTTVLNAVENLYVFHKAIGARAAVISIPRFDYNKISSFGSVEFGSEQREYIGQPRMAQPDKNEKVDVCPIDDLGLEKVHLIKIDIEGMELED